MSRETGAAWWAARRLRLGSLDERTRATVIATLGACGVLGLSILVTSAGWWTPAGGADVAPPGAINEGQPTPRLLLVLGALGLGVAAVAVTAATLQPGWRYARAQRVTLALLGCYVALLTLGATDVLGRGRLPLAAQVVVFLCGWASLAAAVVTAASPLSGGRRRLSLLCAAAPFGLFTVAYLTALLVQRPGDGLPPSAAFVALNGHVVVATVGAVLAWQFLQIARAGRDTAALAGHAARRAPWLLAALLTVKAAWLALGYSRTLAELGLADERWQDSRSDGPVAWGIGALLALAAGAWLLRGDRRRLSDRGVAAGTWLAILAFGAGIAVTGPALVGHVALVLWTALPQLRAPIVLALALGAALARWGSRQAWPLPALAAGLALVAVAAAYVPPARATVLAVVGLPVAPQVAGTAAAVLEGLASAYLPLQLLGVLAAGIAGVVIIRRRPALYSAGFFLVVYGAWTLPLALSVLEVVVLGADPTQPSALTVTIVTLDTMVTAVVAVLALLWWRRRQRAVSPAHLVVMLVVATAAAHAGSLIPDRFSTLAFYGGLGLAVAYAYLLDAESLNIPGPDRPARVLTAVGLACGALALYTLAIGAGTIGPDKDVVALVPRLFAVPVAATVVAATIASDQHEVEKD